MTEQLSDAVAAAVIQFLDGPGDARHAASTKRRWRRPRRGGVATVVRRGARSPLSETP